MPNWCNNTLTLSHSDPAMIARASKAIEERDELLQEFIPCPQALLETTAGYLSGDAQLELEKKQEENIRQYGYKNWYDWKLENWGTKWDICEVNVQETLDNSITLSFDTAWAPPIEAYNALLEQGFEVDAMYNEFGCAFCGTYVDGTEHYIEYSKETLDDIPEELAEHFGIYDMYAEYDDE